MLNKAAADLLEGFADALEIRGANTFRVRAFRNAARRVDSLTTDVAELVESGEISKVRGIGKGIAGVLGEFVAKGRVDEYEEMRAEIPDSVFEMLLIPGLGPKTAATLYNKHGIDSVDALEVAAKEGRLAGIRTIGAKRQARLLRELGRFRERIARRRMGDVMPIAERLIAHVEAAPGVQTVQYAGSLRRGRETIGDLDILASAEEPGPVMEHFVAADDVEEVVGTGGTKTSVLVGGGFQVDLLVVAPDEFGAALAYFTGSKEHNIEIRARALQRGLSLNERGFLDSDRAATTGGERGGRLRGGGTCPGSTRRCVRTGGRSRRPRRERCPRLIELGDIKGELHGHSLWSDGAASIGQMVDVARGRGLAYFAVTDHSGSLLVANGLSPERLAEQAEEIRRAYACCMAAR